MTQTSVSLPTENTSAGQGGTPATEPSTIQPLVAAADSKPWIPLVGASLALCASVAANVFLGWNTVSLRNRYRALVARLPRG